jgi:hypothetical protein
MPSISNSGVALPPNVLEGVLHASGLGYNLDVIGKKKYLRKFGRREAIGTSSVTVWSSPSANETYLTDNLITSVVSSSGADTVQVSIEGHTLSGGEFTFVVQTATLNGQTAVALTTPLARCSRITNTGSTPLVGNISVYETDTLTAGVPDTPAKVHATVSAGYQQTRKGATTISGVDAMIITAFNADILGATSARADMTLEIRQYGGVFIPVFDTGASSSGNSSINIALANGIFVPPNSDIRVTAVGSTTNITVSASFVGMLATVL